MESRILCLTNHEIINRLLELVWLAEDVFAEVCHS